MTTNKIFDLLCSDVTEKFGSYNRIFMQKYVVGNQRIRMHLLKQGTEDLDPVEILHFLNQLQQKYAYGTHWSRFYFSCYWFKDQNITIFEF